LIEDSPFVSIVVPTRNRAPLLRACLEALVGQDHPPEGYEIVIVDDGSTDDTAEVAREFSQRTIGPAVSVVRQEAAGLNAARNEGVRCARGDPVCFVDDDVDVPPGWLRAMVDGFRRYPEAHAFAGPVRIRIEARSRRSCPLHPLASSLAHGDVDTEIPSAIGANMAVRRSGFQRVGAFQPWLVIGGTETEWFDRLRSVGGTTVYLAGAWLWHRRTADDLRLRTLVPASFRRGVAAHRYLIWCGRRDLWPSAIGAIPALVFHAVRDRCLGAVAEAARDSGYAYGLLRNWSVRAPGSEA
jgi:glycosyltransferase involved in cell wall biosynthesis